MDKDGQFASSLLLASSRTYAAGTVDRQFAIQPEAVERYGPRGFTTLVDETEMRIHHLAEAAATDRPALFDAHLAWVKVAAVSRDVPVEFLATNLVCLRDELEERLPPGPAALTAKIITGGLEALERAHDVASTVLADDSPNVDLGRRYLLAVLEGRRADAIELILEARDAGVANEDLHGLLQRVQGEMGRMWQMNQIHSAEEHLGSRIAEELMIILRSRSPRPPRIGRRVLIACVAGNHHELGARMVSDHFEMSGWDALLLGANTPSADVIHGIHDFQPDLLAVSANLTLHVGKTAELIASLRADPLCADVPVMVGGGPFNLVPDLWQVVGADGHATSASDAVAVGEKLVARGREGSTED
jgi:methanogenic corrinoid protein MtbC1